MEKYLIVVDMQKDFVDGSLGSPQARAIVPAVIEKVASHKGQIIFTRDTHGPDYLNSQEGRWLPVEHCIQGSAGWEIIPELEAFSGKEGVRIVNKPGFGSTVLTALLTEEREKIESIELVGLCTDICVVSNALLLKAALPELPIQVDAACCAGVTPEKHRAALETMESCQIQIANK